MSAFYWSPGMTISAMEESFAADAFRFYNNNKQSAANSLGISLEQFEVIVRRSQASAEARAKENAERDRKAADFLARSRGMVGADKDGYTALSPYKPVEGLESVEAAGVLAETAPGASPALATHGVPAAGDPLAAAKKTAMLMEELMPKTEGEIPNA